MKSNIDLKLLLENINNIENINEKYILLKLIESLYKDKKSEYVNVKNIDTLKNTYNKIEKELLNQNTYIPNEEIYSIIMNYKKLLELLIKNYDKNNKKLNNNIESSITILEVLLNLDITYPHKLESCISNILNKYLYKNEGNKSNDSYKNIK